MADPVTMAGVSMAGSAAGGILGAFGAKESATAKNRQYQYQAGIARVNQQIQEKNAEFALEGGEREVEMVGMKHQALMGKIRAAQGASGVDVNSGTNQDVQAGANMIARMDQENARRNMMQKVRGYQSAAWEQGAQANLYDTAARNATKEGKIGALTSIIGGATSVASKWSTAKNTGIF